MIAAKPIDTRHDQVQMPALVRRETHFDNHSFDISTLTAGEARTAELIVGARKLQLHLPELEELRQRCHQQADLVSDLRYFIAANTGVTF